ncbi:MAG: polysaccharide pyruvyl transferase family protein [bacterium]|jgi:pyruvyltransferase
MIALPSCFDIFRRKNVLNVYWYRNIVNFGDTVNPYLVKELGRKHVRWVNPKKIKKDYYLCAGSVLGKANGNATIWGSGFMRGDEKLGSAPKKIHAVRGPLTRELLSRQGMECPDVFGDPVLLLPFLHRPKPEKLYKLGIIPHFVDKDHPWLRKEPSGGIRIIDIQNRNIFAFIEDVNRCERVISSSLHGLIIADAYSIPSRWVKFSDKIGGGNFKFLDYYKSIGKTTDRPMEITDRTTIEDILKEISIFEPLRIDLSKLARSCPFIDEQVLTSLLLKIDTPGPS